MKIQNKYIRNKHFRIKHWKRIRNTEHPFETHMPWFYYNIGVGYSTEEQIADHFDWINIRARGLESGYRHVAPNYQSAPADYRRMLNKQRKAQERVAMQKIRNGCEEVEIPRFKRDAAWLYW